MSFSADWLTMREPVDGRSRNLVVAEAVSAYFADRSPVAVVDLGAGTGSNHRFTRDLLPPGQHWTLVDRDRALLDLAEACDSGGNGCREISTRIADLAQDLDAVLAEGGVDLVTASALLDLVSAAWLDRLVDVLASSRLPIYASLNYDGRETWLPAHEADVLVLQRFHADQRQDKGFGPALGPQACAYFCRKLEDRGFHVVSGQSDWVLGSADRALIVELAAGIARAAASADGQEASRVEDWQAARQGGARCVIGHVDLFAIPG